MEELMQSLVAHNAKLAECLKRYQETKQVTDELYTTSVELIHYLSFFITGVENNEIPLEEE